MRHEPGPGPVPEGSDTACWPIELLPWPEEKFSGFGTVERWHLRVPYDDHDGRVSRCPVNVIAARNNNLPLQVSLLLLRRCAENRQKPVIVISGCKHGPGLRSTLP